MTHLALLRGSDADGAVEYATEGPLSLGGDVEPRQSTFVPGLFGISAGETLAVNFLEEGAGRLIARTTAGDEFSLPIRAVVAADAHTIEGAEELTAGVPTLLTLRSTTADGVAVAGVRGTWSVEPPDLATVVTLVDPASEASIEAKQAGSLTVTVDVDGTMVSRELTVQD